MSSRKTKKVYYRKIRIADQNAPDANFTLEGIFRDAVVKVYQDQEGEDSGVSFILNTGLNGIEYALDTLKPKKRAFERNGCVCGWLTKYYKNKVFALVDANESNAENGIYETTGEPKDDDGKRRNLEESYIVFAICDNHLAFISSDTQGARLLYNYLKWLIQDNSEIIPKLDLEFELPAPEKISTAVKKSPIKAIALTTKGYDDDASAQTESTQEISNSIKSNKLVELLRVFMPNSHSLADIEQKLNAGSQKDVRVVLQIAVEGRKKSDSGLDTVSCIAEALGDNEFLDIEAEQVNGTKIKVKETIIQGDLSVIHDGTNISKIDAMESVSKWLTDELKAGKIPE